MWASSHTSKLLTEYTATPASTSTHDSTYTPTPGGTDGAPGHARPAVAAGSQHGEADARARRRGLAAEDAAAGPAGPAVAQRAQVGAPAAPRRRRQVAEDAARPTDHGRLSIYRYSCRSI